jgi:DNA-binding transcriptional ArsR family regulator
VSDDDTTANRYEWERVLRRVRLGSPTKAVALALATYADRDGSSVRPGVARLSAVTELSERSVRNALTRLRDLGLIERTREGSRNGRRALTDEHRLAIPVDLLERVELLDPDESPAPPAGDRAARQTGSPAPDDTITGTRYPNTGTSRPDHRHQVHPTDTRPSSNQPNYQREDRLRHATTDRARDHPNVIPLSRSAKR